MGRGKRGGIDKDKNGMRAACVVEGVLQSLQKWQKEQYLPDLKHKLTKNNVDPW